MTALLASPHRIKRNHRRRRKAASGRRDYNYFRDYEADVGRYVQSDPKGLDDGPNTFAYVGNDPLAYEDATAEGRVGRGGKQKKLREVMNDPKQSSCVRGSLKQDANLIKKGRRKTLRVPPGFNLAHPRNKPAKAGSDYDCACMQGTDLHKIQHKIGGY